MFRAFLDATDPGLFDGGRDKRSSIEAVEGRVGGRLAAGGPGGPGGPDEGGPPSAIADSAKEDFILLIPPFASVNPIGTAVERGNLDGGPAMARSFLPIRDGGGVVDMARDVPDSERAPRDGETVWARVGGGGVGGTDDSPFVPLTTQRLKSLSNTMELSSPSFARTGPDDSPSFLPHHLPSHEPFGSILGRSSGTFAFLSSVLALSTSWLSPDPSIPGRGVRVRDNEALPNPRSSSSSAS